MSGARRPFLALSVLAALSVTALGAQAPERVPDNPELRWRFFYEQRAYPFAQVPPGALRAAREEMIQRWPALLRAGPAAPLADTTWTAIGPANIPGLFIQSAGRLTAIAIHPADANTIYIGGAQGGVWKTTNGGTSWTPLTDRECSLAMGWIVLDPVNPQIVYAGTGEQHFSADSYYGCGVLRSTDGGATWTRLGAAVFAPANQAGAKISRLVVDPATAGTTTTTVLLVASDFGVHRSTDAGATWTLTRSGIATDLVMDPTNPQVFYVAIGNAFGSTSNGVYKSTNGGVSWTLLPSGFPTANVGRINLGLAPSSPQTVYASIQNSASSTFGDLLGIYRTTDGGATWTQLAATGATCNPQCWYDMHITVHPATPDTVYFGGVQLYKSSNGGASFSNITASIHVDQHVWAFAPANPSTIYAGNDGGIYRSLNGGAQWFSLNTDLAITQFYAGISLHPTDTNIVLGGTQDNGTLRFSGSPSWQNVIGGDGGFTAIDPVTPSFAYGETQWTANSSFGGPRRSTNGGVSFTRMVNGIDTSDRGIFIPPLVLDPARPHTLYFGLFRLYRTRDRGETWTAISPDLTAGSGGISAIAVAASDSMVVYAGTSSGGRVQVTVNGGTNWTLANTGLPNRYVTDIVVDPANSSVAWVTVSGFNTGHVFKTTNRGGSWQDISGNLPNVPVNAIALDAATPDLIYLGTDLGVFRTTNGGTSWAPFNDGMPNVAVFDIALSPTTGLLVAATHGRGMFKVPFDFGTADVTGTVTYYADPSRAVPNAVLVASGGATGRDTTRAAGTYALRLARKRGTVTVTPRKGGDAGAGVSALDAAIVLRCVAGSETCSPAKRLAGDVSGDTTLSALDASLILQKVVGAIDTFPGGLWRFSPGNRAYAPLDTTVSGQNYVATLLGDLTGNWITTVPGPLLARTGSGGDGGERPAARVELGPPRAAGGAIIVPLVARWPGERVYAVEAELSLGDPGDVLGVEPADPATGFHVAHHVDASSRTLRVALAGAHGLDDGGTALLVRLRPGAADRLRLRRAVVNEVEVVQAATSTVAGSAPQVDPGTDPAPAIFALCCSQPNPFSPATGTRLRVDVPSAGGGATRVILRVFNVRGALVRELADDHLDSATHWFTWDGRDERGDVVSSGIYLIVAEALGERRRIRVVLVR